MFKPTPLQKLYPHLNFTRIEPPSRSVSQPPIPTQIVPPVVEKPKVIEKVVERPVPVEVKPIIKEEIEKSSKVTKKVKVVEKEPPKVETKPEPVKVEEPPKPKQSRPNRLKPEPKPEPKRGSQIPKKGEKGLQSQYTLEQKRQMYLDRLSRKSVKRAEQEVGKINEVLESVEHDPKRLGEEERKIKSRLKLINYAKFFATDNINEESKESTKDYLREESTRPSVSSVDRQPKRVSTIGKCGRGRGRRSASSSESDTSEVTSGYGGESDTGESGVE